MFRNLNPLLPGVALAVVMTVFFSLAPDPPVPFGAQMALASTKLSQINNGGLVSSATDMCVAVRNGNIDELISVGALAAGAVDGTTLNDTGNVAGINLTNANTWTGLQTLKQSDAATTTVTNAGVLTHDTSGTPAAGYGTGLLFEGQSTTTVDRSMADIAPTWTTATDASRAANLVFQTANNTGLTTAMTLSALAGETITSTQANGIDLTFQSTNYAGTGDTVALGGSGAMTINTADAITFNPAGAKQIGFEWAGGNVVDFFSEGSNILGQRLTTNAQASRVYNTWTSATNFERGTFDWIQNSNVFTIGTEKGSGGGSVRALQFITGGSNALQLDTSQNGIFSAGLEIGAPTGGLKGTGTVNGTALYQNGTQVFSTPGTGLAASGATVNSNAVYQVSYQPGLLSAVNSNIGVYSKIGKAATVDNIEGSAVTFSCVSNPTITMYECGTSATCTSSPTTIGTVTVTAAATVVDGTVSSSAITAGDYIGFAFTGGTCASIDIAVTAQVHSN